MKKDFTILRQLYDCEAVVKNLDMLPLDGALEHRVIAVEITDKREPLLFSFSCNHADYMKYGVGSRLRLTYQKTSNNLICLVNVEKAA